MARVKSRFGGALAAVLFVSLLWGCTGDERDVTAPPDLPPLQLMFTQDLGAAIAVQRRITDDLLTREGIVGTGVGVTEDGEPVVKVFFTRADVAQVPAAVEGVRLVVEVTGEFFALKGKPPKPPKDNGVDHTARFDRPVPLGISTGHPSITAGTIGARVRRGPNQVFALSNNHVYAATNCPSPCHINDAVIQPGTFDGGSSPVDNIGNLSAFVTIDFTGANNTVDAAIVSTTTALLGNSTTSDCYGTPKSTTLAAAVNMKVKKCGRTTEQTKGTILAINATVFVNYGAPGVARFVNQIITTNISAGGDSGALVVVDGKGKNKGDDRKPVGLLYAGSNNTTVLNPIDAVLDAFSVTIDGEQ